MAEAKEVEQRTTGVANACNRHPSTVKLEEVGRAERPTVCLDATSLAASRYEYDSGEVMRIAIAQKQWNTARCQELRDLMQHGVGHSQRALSDLYVQAQLALPVDRGPDPVGRTRETLNGLGFTDLAVSRRTEHGVEFVELDLIKM
jgi:hypothetical protein